MLGKLQNNCVHSRHACTGLAAITASSALTRSWAALSTALAQPAKAKNCHVFQGQKPFEIRLICCRNALSLERLISPPLGSLGVAPYPGQKPPLRSSGVKPYSGPPSKKDSLWLALTTSCYTRLACLRKK